jgi:hypothetical protein
VKKIIGTFIVLFLVCCLTTTIGNAQENQKLAQTGFQFLSVTSDARGAAMGEAMTSLQTTASSSLFFNPAGMAGMTNFVDVTASVNEWIGNIKHYQFSIAINPSGGNFGAFGLSIQSVNYGDFYGTVVDQTSDLGYRDTEIFQLNAMAAGIGYAKRLSDQFSIGGQVRMVRQDLGTSVIPVYGQKIIIDSTGNQYAVSDTTSAIVSNKLTPLVFDFGTQFKTGIKSLVFGMSVRNFSKEMKYVQEGFQAPLVFNLGISMNLFDLLSNIPEDNSLTMSVDATHYVDHPEQIKVGIEYNFRNMLKLRGGYVSKSDYDESSFSYGLGLALAGFAFDYTYTPFGIFDKVQRMTARFSY